MDTLLSNVCVGLSELRESPSQVFAQAHTVPVAVLNHNKPTGYILSPALMERLLDQLSDLAIAHKAKSRLKDLPKAKFISIDAL